MSMRKIISISFVNNNHFVGVLMQPRAPMLLIVRNWHRSQYHYVEGRATPYVPTIKMLCSLISNNVITKDTIDLDANV
ncbi:hypothetical protein CK203_092605 [Vitis vinifera]|uniref:Uncharacterized protein n=1 Tax=Vitis vinifera TaxID=29760 RepID=A0A438BUV3_VITVI|nr:hypothetical protein CK203_092605 [Vitis vinifera]